MMRGLSLSPLSLSLYLSLSFLRSTPKAPAFSLLRSSKVSDLSSLSKRAIQNLQTRQLLAGCCASFRQRRRRLRGSAFASDAGFKCRQKHTNTLLLSFGLFFNPFGTSQMMAADPSCSAAACRRQHRHLSSGRSGLAIVDGHCADHARQKTKAKTQTNAKVPNSPVEPQTPPSLSCFGLQAQHPQPAASSLVALTAKCSKQVFHAEMSPSVGKRLNFSTTQ